MMIDDRIPEEIGDGLVALVAGEFIAAGRADDLGNVGVGVEAGELVFARGQWIEESLVFEAQSAVEVLFVAGDGIEVEERFIHAAVLDHLDAGQLLVAERRNPRGRPIGHANRGAEG